MNRNIMNRNLVVVTAVLIVVLGATAGCRRSTPIPADTAPIFAATVVDQTYTVGEAIAELTLPAARGGNGELTYSLEPAVPGLSFDPATRTLSGTPTSAGSYALEYRVEDGDDNTAASDGATLTFTVTVEEPAPPDTAPIFAATVADQTYTVGEAIAELTLPAASGGNGELTYSLEPAVPGLSFDPAARTLSGTPTSAGSYALEYRVEDGDDNTAASDGATLTFTVTVEEPAPPDTAPSFSATVADQTYTVGEAIAELTLPAASGGNGELTYSLEPAVPGLSFDPATRTLSGTPTNAGSYALEYRVEDGDDNTAASDGATLTFTVTVEEEPAPPPDNWTAVVNVEHTVFDDVVWSESLSRFVAIGSIYRPFLVGTFIVHSPDGEVWTTVSIDTSETLNAVTWSESLSRFVAVGSASTIIHSEDGQTWSEASSSGTWLRFLSGVTWSESLSRFVAVGENGIIIHSSDGDTWSVAATSGATNHLVSVSWSESQARFVAVGPFYTTIVHSPDGDTWSPAGSSPPGSLSGVTWGESSARFVAVGLSFTTSTIMHSSDGDTWTAASSVWDGIFFEDVVWSDSLRSFVAVGTDGFIVHSRDGDSWSEVATTGTSHDLLSVAWSETLARFVAVGGTFVIEDGALIEVNGVIVVSQ